MCLKCETTVSRNIVCLQTVCASTNTQQHSCPKPEQTGALAQKGPVWPVQTENFQVSILDLRPHSWIFVSAFHSTWSNNLGFKFLSRAMLPLVYWAHLYPILWHVYVLWRKMPRSPVCILWKANGFVDKVARRQNTGYKSILNRWRGEKTLEQRCKRNI